MLTPWKRHAHEIAPLSTTSISSFSPSPDVPLTQSYADFMSLFERDCMESGYRRYKRVPKPSTKVSVRPSTQYFVVLHKRALLQPQAHAYCLLQFDGASRLDPPVSASGFVLLDCVRPHENNFARDIVFEGATLHNQPYTNNASEWLGLIEGMQRALDRDVEYLLVEGDSMLVVQQLLDFAMCKLELLLSLRNRALVLARQFKFVAIRHVYRSRNNNNNNKLTHVEPLRHQTPLPWFRSTLEHREFEWRLLSPAMADIPRETTWLQVCACAL